VASLVKNERAGCALHAVPNVANGRSRAQTDAIGRCRASTLVQPTLAKRPATTFRSTVAGPRPNAQGAGQFRSGVSLTCVPLPNGVGLTFPAWCAMRRWARTW
jgi:hypothetical protein